MKISIFTLLLLIGIKGIAQTLIPYYDSGKYGYCDIDGTVKILAQYDKVDFFSSNSLVIVTKGNEKVIIDKTGFEFSSYPKQANIQLLSVYPHADKNYRWKRPQPDDIIKHLVWVQIDENEYQLLNLTSQSTSAIYKNSLFKDPFSPVQSLPRAKRLLHGYHIGILSEHSYDILNKDGIVIINSQNEPAIWSTESITLKVNDKQCLYNPITEHTNVYPYKSIINVTDDNYLIVSTEEQNTKWGYRLHSINKKTKYGVISIEGEVILDTLYQSIDFHNRRYILQENDNILLNDLMGNLVDLSEYKSITPLNDKLFLAKRHDGKVKVLNLEGEIILNNQTFDEFKYRKNENYYTARKDKTLSILDSTLNVEINYAAESIHRDYERSDRYGVSSNGLNGIINSKKEIIVPIKYDRCYYNRYNLINLSIDGKNGLANSNGEVILEPEYEKISIQEVNGDTLLMPKKDGFYACYNLEGEQLSGFVSSSYYISGRAINSYRDNEDDLYHFTDYYGNPLNISSKHSYNGYTKKDSVFITVLNERDTIYEIFIEDEKFRDWGKGFDSIVKVNIPLGLVAIAKGNEQALMDVDGKIISPLTEQSIIEMNEEYFISKKKEKYFLYDYTGEQINDFGYDYVSGVGRNGRRSVDTIVTDRFYQHKTKNRKTGENTFTLKPQKKIGYLDKYGEVLIPLIYNSTFRYIDNYAFLTIGYVEGQKQGFIFDTLGQVVFQTKAENLYPLHHTEYVPTGTLPNIDKPVYFKAQINGSYGLIDIEGNTVIPFEYKSIQGFFAPEIIRVEDFNDKWHLINIDNEIIFSGYHYMERDYFQAYTLAKDKILFFPNGKSEIIDRNGKVYLKIDSQKLNFVEKDGVDLIEVDMDKFKYYINRETLIEYRNTND